MAAATARSTSSLVAAGISPALRRQGRRLRLRLRSDERQRMGKKRTDDVLGGRVDDGNPILEDGDFPVSVYE